MPFFRSRCLVSKQRKLIPNYGDLVQGDTWRMAKNSIKQYRNTLDNTAYTVLGQSEKTKVDSVMWMEIWFKHNENWERSMNYIDDHCVKDVRMTCKILKAMEKFNTVSRVYV
jgi:predicted SPOUT superfamily RNA methylase MTH1